jgi:hypothetical protein
MLKFRAWNEKTKKYVNRELTSIDGLGNIDFGGADVNFIQIELFTGEIDIHGNEVYVNDIIRSKQGCKTYIGKSFAKNGFRAASYYDSVKDWNSNTIQTEVVGNMNENKDRLNDVEIYSNCIPFHNKPYLEVCKLYNDDIIEEDFFIFFDNEGDKNILRESIYNGSFGQSKTLKMIDINSEIKWSLKVKGYSFS